MSQEPRDELEAELEREKLDRLLLSTRLFMKQERHDDAQATIDELREQNPANSEIWELQGDLLRAQGKRKAAREAYQKAFDLDGSNVNAERKYAELVLFMGEEHRAKQQQQRLLEDPDAERPDKPPNQTKAIIYACLFPGFGQLYNRQHEKGLAFFAVGAIILILLVYGVVVEPWQKVVESVAGQASGRTRLPLPDQIEMAIQGIEWWQWLLAILGLIVFLALHVVAIADAAVVARRRAKEADQLGIEVPG